MTNEEAQQMLMELARYYGVPEEALQMLMELARYYGVPEEALQSINPGLLRVGFGELIRQLAHNAEASRENGKKGGAPQSVTADYEPNLDGVLVEMFFPPLDDDGKPTRSPKTAWKVASEAALDGVGDLSAAEKKKRKNAYANRLQKARKKRNKELASYYQTAPDWEIDPDWEPE